jgi:uncharacterized membrane protein
VLLAATAVAVPAVAHADTCTWTPTALPIPAGAESASVAGTDDTGGYVGEADWWDGENATSHAVLWRNGTVTDLGAPAGEYAYVVIHDANRSDTLVGSNEGSTANVYEHAVKSSNGKMVRLPEPAGAQQTWANSINDNGDIVGTAVLPAGGNKTVLAAVEWPASAPGTVRVLTGLPSGQQSEAVGVDQDGTVIVSVTAAGDPTDLRPYVWRNGTARALPVLSTSDSSEPKSISNGLVAGFTGGAAVVWNTKTDPITITQLPGGNDALSINSAGQVVGWTYNHMALTYHVWQGTQLTSTLPPPGEGDVIGDDGTIGGWASGIGPAKWVCA